ncbi:MAG: hypothetical protein LBS09_05225 [Bacteroidales bacterium]|jgi:hypothetical protein|nr:hypothetical protein [Bacteroidales bacterium]
MAHILRQQSMTFAEHYLARHDFLPKIREHPHRQTGIIVVVPACNEPDLLHSLHSLRCCVQPSCAVEVIVVVNHAVNADEGVKRQNEQTLHETQLWAVQHSVERLHFHVICAFDVPEKSAGVGFARKTGMDEAVYRFNLLNAPNGVIAGFDADAKCDADYLSAVECCFIRPDINGASIYFEHPVEGNEFPSEIYEGITLYELHLRYMNQALRYCGFPYACHTVGSSFAVRVSAYVKQGGMNRRKAGEDFHFLHKIIPLGNYGEINATRVIPSPRISDRVPFGTGACMRQWINEGAVALYTYPIEAFDALKAFFALIPEFYADSGRKIQTLCSTLPQPIREYLEQNDYLCRIRNVYENSASAENFRKRFWTWFDALQVVKYLNRSCRTCPKQPVEVAARCLLQRMEQRDCHFTAKELLMIYRRMEREIEPKTSIRK